MLKNGIAFIITIFCLKINKVIHTKYIVFSSCYEVTSLRSDFLISKENRECSNPKVDLRYIDI